MSDLDRFEGIVGNVLLARSELLKQFTDPRRDIYDECGYPRSTSFAAEQYQDLFDREHLANRVVRLLPSECWQSQPTVFESEDVDDVTDFERAWDSLDENLRGDRSYYRPEAGSVVWEYLHRLDEQSGIGQFGVLLLGIDDGKLLQEPVDGMLADGAPSADTGPKDVSGVSGPVVKDLSKDIYGGSIPQQQLSSIMGTDSQYFGTQFTPSSYHGGDPANPMAPSEQAPGEPGAPMRRLLFLRVFPEYLVQIVQYEADIRSPRFGQPLMYYITLNDPRQPHTGVGLPLATVRVHWTRVIHVADNLTSSEIFGVPRMRPILNRLLDLQKLYGGSAEMYWRGAFPGFSIETVPQLGGDVVVDREKLRGMMEDYMNGLQRYLTLMGMSAKSLAPQVVDPSPQINVQIEAIAIQVGCPVRVLKGSERGEMASNQDDAKWNDRLSHRQVFHVTPRIVVPFVDRLIAIGVLPKPKVGRNDGDALAANCRVVKRGGRLIVVNDDTGSPVGQVANGYTVKWPPLDSLGAQDKSMVSVQRMQTIASYVTSGSESILPPKEFLTHIMDFDKEEAQAIIDAAADAEQSTMSIPPMGEVGHPGTPTPPGAPGHPMDEAEEAPPEEEGAPAGNVDEMVTYLLNAMDTGVPGAWRTMEDERKVYIRGAPERERSTTGRASTAKVKAPSIAGGSHDAPKAEQQQAQAHLAGEVAAQATPAKSPERAAAEGQVRDRRERLTGEAADMVRGFHAEAAKAAEAQAQAAGVAASRASAARKVHEDAMGAGADPRELAFGKQRSELNAQHAAKAKQAADHERDARESQAKASAAKAAHEKEQADHAAASKAAGERAAAAKAASDKAVAAKAAHEKAAAESRIRDEKAAHEAAAKAAADHAAKAKEASDKEAAVKLAREMAGKAQKAREEKEAAEKAKADKAAADKAVADKAVAEKAVADKAVADKAAKEAKEKADKEEKTRLEKAAKEAVEKASKEKEEKDAKDKAAKDAAEKAVKEAADKAAKEKADKEDKDILDKAIQRSKAMAAEAAKHWEERQAAIKARDEARRKDIQDRVAADDAKEAVRLAAEHATLEGIARAAKITRIARQNIDEARSLVEKHGGKVTSSDEIDLGLSDAAKALGMGAHEHEVEIAENDGKGNLIREAWKLGKSVVLTDKGVRIISPNKVEQKEGWTEHHEAAHQMFVKSIRASGADRETIADRLIAAKDVVSKLTEKGAEGLRRATPGGVTIHADMYAVTKAAERISGEKYKEGTGVAGFYMPRAGELHLAEPGYEGSGIGRQSVGTKNGTYAHETSHALDAAMGGVSKTNAWQRAFNTELSKGQISDYGSTSASEGFAEFGRLVHSGKLSDQEMLLKFPMATAIWKGLGYKR